MGSSSIARLRLNVVGHREQLLLQVLHRSAAARASPAVASYGDRPVQQLHCSAYVARLARSCDSTRARHERACVVASAGTGEHALALRVQAAQRGGGGFCGADGFVAESNKRGALLQHVSQTLA